MENKIIIKKFSLMLYNAIKESNISYEDIACKLGLTSKREINSYVNGEKWPSPERLLKIIYFLKLDLNYLFDSLRKGENR